MNRQFSPGARIPATPGLLCCHLVQGVADPAHMTGPAVGIRGDKDCFVSIIQTPRRVNQMGKRNHNFQRFVRNRSGSLKGSSQAQLPENHGHAHQSTEEQWDSWYCECGTLCRRLIVPDYGPLAGKLVEIFRNGRQRVVDE